MSTQISDKFSAWQAECEARFQQLKANEEELNRIFIGIYGLQDELTPEVADKDVKDGTQKYPNGTAARTWVHITGDHCSSTAHITEGAVKGDVSSFLDGNSLYICVPGVSSINHLLPAIRSLPNIERVESLFDMDQIEDEKYSKALLHMIKMLKSLGIPVEQRQWNPDYNGVDEYKAYCRAARLAA